MQQMVTSSTGINGKRKGGTTHHRAGGGSHVYLNLSGYLPGLLGQIVSSLWLRWCHAAC